MSKQRRPNDELNNDTAVAGHQLMPSTIANEFPEGAGPTSPNAPDGENYNKPYRVRTAYGPRQRVQLRCSGVGRTKQSFKAECDINVIMSRYLKTGVLEHVRQGVARYGDVSGADFQEAQNFVAGAISMFHDLPSHIRTMFENQPALFFDFMENPANAAKARELGLVAPENNSSTPPSGEVASVKPDAASSNVEAKAPGGTPAQTLPAKAA